MLRWGIGCADPEVGRHQAHEKPATSWLSLFDLLRIAEQVRHAPKIKKPLSGLFMGLAEREGFEPPDLLQSTVFKTAAIDRSAISPRQK